MVRVWSGSENILLLFVALLFTMPLAFSTLNRACDVFKGL